MIEVTKSRCSSAIPQVARQLGIKDQETITQAGSLVRRVLHRKKLIDRILDLAIDPTHLNDLDPRIQSFLRIFAMTAKFDSKGLEEAAKLAAGGRSILGWKNMLSSEAHLGRILKIDVREIVSGLNEYDKISMQTSYPVWFVKYCIHLLGRRETLRLLRYHKSPATYIRVGTSIHEEVLKEIGGASILLAEVEGLPYLYRVVRGRRLLTRTEAYTKRLFSFHDITSCLAAALGRPRTGHIVFDVGFGSVDKAAYLSQLMNNKGKILSIDSSTRRLATLEHEARKAGIEIVETVLSRIDQPPLLYEQADIVVLNPRCTDTGMMWRAPSLKMRVKWGVEDAAKVQWRAIDGYADYVKEGGTLVYWTRSITVEENEALIERFLKLHPEFRVVEAWPRLGEPGLRGQRECQRLYPHLHGTDCSFFAKLEREW